jgi:UDP-3-O-[3-hydroxymyristoyl] glucosamine N-acyltransferase
MSQTIEKIADIVGGKLNGDGTIEIVGVANLETAQRGEISFLEKAEFAAQAAHTNASCLIIPENFNHELPCRCKDFNAKCLQFV